MDPEIQKKFEEQDEKLSQIYASVEKIRKYNLWSLAIYAAIIILPLLGLAVLIKPLLDALSGLNFGL